MKAIAIGLLAAASIALSAPANAHIWVDGRGWIPGWGVGDYWKYDRGYIGPTANNYWRLLSGSLPGGARRLRQVVDHALHVGPFQIPNRQDPGLRPGVFALGECGALA
jgi:hypothetical protein